MLRVQNSDIGRMSLSSNNEHINTVKDYTQCPIDLNNFSIILTYNRELISCARFCVHVITHDTESCAVDILFVSLRSLCQIKFVSHPIDSLKKIAEPELLQLFKYVYNLPPG